LTKLEGVKLADGQVKKTIDINLDSLLTIAVKMNVRGFCMMKKKPLCAALVDLLHARRELEKLTGVAPVNDDGANINWNMPRLLNIIFSDEFANHFVMHGKSLDKEELGNGIAVNKLLIVDFMVAYNDSSNAVYGELAFLQSQESNIHPCLMLSLPTTHGSLP
jgi:hypothetical protein